MHTQVSNTFDFKLIGIQKQFSHKGYLFCQCTKYLWLLMSDRVRIALFWWNVNVDMLISLTKIKKHTFLKLISQYFLKFEFVSFFMCLSYIYRLINIFCIYIILPFIYFLTTAIFLSESNIINWPPFSEHIFSDVWRGLYSRWKEKHHIPSRINSSSLTVFLIKLTKTKTN